MKVPFDDLYTSVFLVSVNEKYTLVDCATTSKDVDEYIEPALKKFGITFLDIESIVITHGHDDHSGGLSRVLQKNPKIRIVRSVENLDGLEIYPMPGHTKDFIGVFCYDSDTLISGDGLQCEGVGKYRCFLESKDDYFQTIEKIKRDRRIKNLLFSHAYEPFCVDYAFGREEIERVLKCCKR